MLANRKPMRVLRALARPAVYKAAFNMARRVENAPFWLKRYLLGGGTYPAMATVRTRSGPFEVRMWSHHDLLTLNEIFCRLDYEAKGDELTIVDFGSNVGISAAYFLTEAPKAKVFLFEPVPFNIAHLKEQLGRFEDRYVLTEAAVSTEAGTVDFGVEDTGRYCGINRGTRTMPIPAVSAREALSAIVAERGRIDLLKIDIEGMERPILESLPRDLLEKIGVIYAETDLAGSNPFPATHRMEQVAINMARLDPIAA